jgi:CRISPR-associated endonuclease/helicase Cas3
MLYWRKGAAELDKRGVMEMCAAHTGDMNFPFESIAAAMRFIDDVMVPVIVAREEAEAGTVAALVNRLRFAEGVGGIARQLGRYSVGIPRSVRATMLAEKVAECIRPGDFGDQFVVLLNLELYTAETGLVWNDLAFRTAESLIF